MQVLSMILEENDTKTPNSQTKYEDCDNTENANRDTV